MDATLRARASATTWLLLVAVLLMGLAQIAVTPPWEGYDEPAHWSYIQQLADTGRAPVYGRDRFSADLQAYPGPGAYSQVPADRTYTRFRTAPHAIAGHPTHYRPAGVLNWQAQHPPLFYALMVPVYRAVAGLGWVDHLAVLRTVSWLLAWVGWAVAVIATLKASSFGEPRPSDRAAAPAFGPWTAPLMAMWPLLFGNFFSDLARLGNDSLCLLLAGLAWAVLLRLAPERRPRPLAALAIGLLLGAGLWTKAFFGPITVGVGALLAARAVRDRSVRAAVDAALAVGVAAAIGAAWYLAKLSQTGALTGSDESIRLLQAGGLMHGLATRFSLGEAVRGVAGVLQSLPWTGGWSLVRMPSLLIYAALLVAVAPTVAYVRRLPRLPLAAWAPVAFAVPMLLGLGYHILVRIALDGSGLGTPGWYLNVVAPALGAVIALGWTAPRLSSALALYSIGYTFLAQAFQLSLYSGCATPDPTRHFTLTGAHCLVNLPTLERLGHPGAGAICMALGVILAAGALIAASPWGATNPGAATELKPLGA